MNSLSPPSFFCFLARSPYHNSIHAADVLMSTNLFLTSFGLTDRLTKSELLAVLASAVIHDFDHPGTTNAHEMKVLSKRTITYSDNAPLEHSHLAAAFTIINTSGYNILSGLGSEGFRGARKLIIELVLYTDLAKHFEFISRLQGIAADDREARAAARNSKRQSLTISPEIAGARHHAACHVQSSG